MFSFNVKGTYYDIGYSYGEHLKAQVKNGYPMKFSAENLEKSKTYEKVIQDYCPGILDEIRGMSDASGVDYQSIVTLECTPFRIKPQCLVFAVTGDHTQTGKPLLVRNHEWLEEDGENLAVCNVQPKGKLASYGFTFHWPLLSRYGGINEAGLAISSASASFTITGPGIMLNIAKRWILDNFKTTEEAVEFLQDIPKEWGTNYLIIDKTGTLVKLETHKEKTLVTYPKDGFDMVTMTFESPEMQKLHPNESPNVLKLLNKRKKFLDKWFAENKGKITEESIIEILKDCENSLHYHDKAPNGTYGTCWSWILSPEKDEALISTGPPCRNDFQTYKIDYSK